MFCTVATLPKCVKNNKNLVVQVFDFTSIWNGILYASNCYNCFRLCHCTDVSRMIVIEYPAWPRLTVFSILHIFFCYTYSIFTKKYHTGCKNYNFFFLFFVFFFVFLLLLFFYVQKWIIPSSIWHMLSENKYMLRLHSSKKVHFFQPKKYWYFSFLNKNIICWGYSLNRSVRHF